MSVFMTIPMLRKWLASAGLEAIRVVHECVTDTDEQRSTEWMPFESLSEALDPQDPSLTTEGWPAPRRVVIICVRP